MARHVDRLIMEMQQKLNVTSIVVTHDLHSAFSIGDRVAMLYEGKVAEVAAPGKFVKSKLPFIREFIQAQFETGSVKGIEL